VAVLRRLLVWFKSIRPAVRDPINDYSKRSL